MVTEYRHGIETIEVDDAIRPIQLGPSNVIGLVGTAPDADPDLFPINEPILIAGNARDALALGTTGTLPDAIEGVFDQFGADVVLVRVTESQTTNVQLSNLIGQQTALTGLFALKKAKALLSLIPKILIVPGYTAQRPADGVASVDVNTGGQGYLSAANVIITSAGDGQGDTYLPVVQNGGITAVVPQKKGFAFSAPPTLTVTDSSAAPANGTLTFTANAAEGDTVTIGSRTYTITATIDAANKVKLGVDAATTVSNLIAAINAGTGSGTAYGTGTAAHTLVTASAGTGTALVVTSKASNAAANAIATTKSSAVATWGSATLIGGLGGSGAVLTAVLGHVANPVVAELIGVAEDMRAIIIADSPGTSYVDAIAWRNDFDTDRLWIVEGGVQVWDAINNVAVVEPAAPRLAGMQAYMDQNFGFWYSASNQPLNGVVGVNRIIDWSFTSSTVEGQLLNSQAIAVVVHDAGFRVLGTRSPTSKSVWKFLPVRRTADQVYDAIENAMREAVDKPINLGLLDWIEGSVNAALRTLAAQGAIIDGKAWLDKSLNPVTQLQNGQLVIDFDIEPPAPLERLTFRAHRNAGYYTEVLDAFLLNAQ
jgi:phage tail sheath protein FI